MIKGLVLLTLIFNSIFCLAQTGDLHINVSGISSSQGIIYVFLYSSEDGFPVDLSKADKFIKAKIASQSASVSFDNIKYGYYAISVYHDEDSSGKINTNFFGIPKESVGVSNNAKGLMGPPKYDDAKFYFNKDITIGISIE